ncbi:hypothetical protein K431DRAFT_315697 [Polychaeton citri CBS 116435]|uniref:Tat pathway signal sequence n=1 Tax=Polychaeton citri CBS 116435 TaxID=1314669 RepID=A0A9P4ULP0_9PEZI|nr:hypothetical protein K431DRAFT_315697 [Polychaeton citri CBS 116435]
MDIENARSTPYEEEKWSPSDSLISEDAQDFPIYRGQSSRSAGWKRWPWALIMHSVLITAYSIGVAVTIMSVNSRLCPPDLTHSPAAHAVQYEKVSFNGSLSIDNPYKGEPRPELDQAWSHLIRNLNIRLSKEELDKLNRSAIELHDGSGYHAELSVYHHIHCLKYIRQALHGDYYHLNPYDRDTHVDHCIDDIRQALMCNPDLSVVTMEWKPHYRRPWPNFNVDHTCVNWEVLDEWASRRSFNIFDQKSLVHPEMGLVFPLIDGEYEDIAGGEGIHIIWPEDSA